LLLGRNIQRAYGQPQQAILTMPLLTGIDGKEKMSKSYGNHIGVADPPDEMYGRTLRIPDESLPSWYGLLFSEVPDPGQSPRDAKRALARALVDRFHGPGAGEAAEEHFDRVHIQRQAPEEIATVEYPANGEVVHLPAVLAEAFGVSTSEARRSLAQGGVRLDGEPLPPGTLDLPAAEVHGRVLQLGKRRFARIEIR
jgi:tyrosyl-tRNA synthetase